MIGPISRIIVRYLVGGGIAYGLLSPEIGAQIEPDAVLVASAAIGVLVEGVYTLARRYGWAT